MSDHKPSTPRDLYQEATDRIIKALESGFTPWQKPWEDVNTGPLRNGVSDRAYRGGVNSILLHASSMERNFTDPRWVTFKQCQDNGWKVKKGAKSERIYFSKPLMVDERDFSTGQVVIDAATGKPRQKQIPYLQSSQVFNAQEIDGMPPLPKGDFTFSPLEAGEEILKRSPVSIKYGGNRAFYNIANDSITLPQRTQFKNEEAFYATAAHEIIHSTGHKDRCNREFGKRFGDNAYAAEEMTAELGSYALSLETGLPSQVESHASYIDHWLKVLKSDKKAIFTVSANAARAVDMVMGRQNLDAKSEQAAEAEKTLPQKPVTNPAPPAIKPLDTKAQPLAAMIPSTIAVVAKLKERRANQSGNSAPKTGPAMGA